MSKMSINSATFWSNLMANVAAANEIKMNHTSEIEDAIMEVLQKRFPTSKFWVYSFGSRVMGVAQKDSDLDIYVKKDNFIDYSDSTRMSQVQCDIASAFRNQPNWEFLENRGGRCPIVCVVYKPQKLHIDISFTNPMTVKQNELVLYLFELQPVARYMVIFLREWTRLNNLHEGFRGHIIILMVIFFLQIKSHLPGIDKLQKNLYTSVGPWIESFNKIELSEFSMKKILMGQIETREQLKEFFKYYSSFDFSQYAICPYLGILVARSSIKSQMPARYTNHRRTIYASALIMDFINFNDNKGKQLKTYDINRFKQRCSSA